MRVPGRRCHCVLGRSKLRADFDSFVADGFTGGIEDLNAVAHLDDDKWNCNIGNLMNMPEAWNYNLKKSQRGQAKGKEMALSACHCGIQDIQYQISI